MNATLVNAAVCGLLFGLPTVGCCILWIILALAGQVDPRQDVDPNPRKPYTGRRS